MEGSRAYAATAQATTGQAGATLGIEPGVLGRHFVDIANWSGLAILARRVSLALDLLATAETVGRRRGVAECVAHTARDTG